MNKWEEFANSNAEYYILTHENVDFLTQEGQNYFFKSGEEDTSLLLKNVSSLIPNKGRALEIGCGIGRLAFAHANIFQEVYGVDISETMLKKFNALASIKNIKNVRTFHFSDHWDLENHYDYIYSYIVFQHIVEFSVIEEYIGKISNAISKDGLIQLHFDTRKASLLYQLRKVIPNLLLPKSQRIGIRRNRRDPERLKEVFEHNNLELIQELNPQSANHFFILRKK